MKIKTLFFVPPTLGADSDDLFPSYGYSRTDEFEHADGIVFCGGADISPKLYGQTPIPGVYVDGMRDAREKTILKMNQGKPMIGICRGAQFLNVMAGGTLYQHVNNHGGIHPINVYDAEGRLQGVGKVNSVHHQQMRPGPGGIVLGDTSVSTLRMDDKTVERSDKPFRDVEIVWYPDRNWYCFQGHPEFGHPETTALFFRQLEELFV